MPLLLDKKTRKREKSGGTKKWCKLRVNKEDASAAAERKNERIRRKGKELCAKHSFLFADSKNCHHFNNSRTVVGGGGRTFAELK